MSESTSEKKSEAGKKGAEARWGENQGQSQGGKEDDNTSGSSGSMSREEAGRKGGEARKEEGADYSEMGRKGGESRGNERKSNESENR